MRCRRHRRRSFRHHAPATLSTLSKSPAGRARGPRSGRCVRWPTSTCSPLLERAPPTPRHGSPRSQSRNGPALRRGRGCHGVARRTRAVARSRRTGTRCSHPATRSSQKPRPGVTRPRCASTRMSSLCRGAVTQLPNMAFHAHPRTGVDRARARCGNFEDAMADFRRVIRLGRLLAARRRCCSSTICLASRASGGVPRTSTTARSRKARRSWRCSLPSSPVRGLRRSTSRQLRMTAVEVAPYLRRSQRALRARAAGGPLQGDPRDGRVRP